MRSPKSGVDARVALESAELQESPLHSGAAAPRRHLSLCADGREPTCGTDRSPTVGYDPTILWGSHADLDALKRCAACGRSPEPGVQARNVTFPCSRPPWV